MYILHINHQTDTVSIWYTVSEKKSYQPSNRPYISIRYASYQRTQNRKKRAEVLFNDILKTKSIRHCGPTDIDTSASFTTKIICESINIPYFHPKNTIQWVFSPKTASNERCFQKPSGSRRRVGRVSSWIPTCQGTVIVFDWDDTLLPTTVPEPEIRVAMVLGSQGIEAWDSCYRWDNYLGFLGTYVIYIYIILKQ